MSEWVLIVTLSIAANAGTVRDVSPEIVTGFSTRERCEAAGTAIAENLIRLVGDHREQAGLVPHHGESIPRINTRCMRITK